MPKIKVERPDVPTGLEGIVLDIMDQDEIFDPLILPSRVKEDQPGANHHSYKKTTTYEVHVAEFPPPARKQQQTENRHARQHEAKRTLREHRQRKAKIGDEIRGA